MTQNALFGRRSRSSERLRNSTPGTRPGPRRSSRPVSGSSPARSSWRRPARCSARVQAAAEPGTVLVTSTVLRQVAGQFIVEEKGAHEFRGAPAPVTLYRILRISGGRRRRGARLLTSFVGREQDLAILARCSEHAFAGAGQFVLIVGEPGIGKSRLVEEFRSQLAERPHSWIEWSSSQLLQNTPLHP